MSTKEIFSQLLRYFPAGEETRLYTNMRAFGEACLAAGEFEGAEAYADLLLAQDKNAGRQIAAYRIKLFAKLRCRTNEEFRHCAQFSKELPEYMELIAACEADDKKLAAVIKLAEENTVIVAKEKQRETEEEQRQQRREKGEKNRLIGKTDIRQPVIRDSWAGRWAKYRKVAAISTFAFMLFFLIYLIISAGMDWNEGIISGGVFLFVFFIAGILCLAISNREILFNKGIAVYKQRNYSAAFAFFARAAQKNHIKAQYCLGLCYNLGYGTHIDQANALFWFNKAAEQGDMEAQCNLGIFYARGIGVLRDDVKAVYWFEKAAEQGYAAAQYNLGIRYKNGIGIKQDCAQVLYWYQRAANQKDADAQNNLGLCYETGIGTAPKSK